MFPYCGTPYTMRDPTYPSPRTRRKAAPKFKVVETAAPAEPSKPADLTEVFSSSFGGGRRLLPPSPAARPKSPKPLIVVQKKRERTVEALGGSVPGVVAGVGTVIRRIVAAWLARIVIKGMGEIQ
jgi:hypothetical protein